MSLPPDSAFLTRDRSWSRRQVVTGLAAIAASYSLGGCGGGPPTQLSVSLLPNMLPGSIWREISRTQLEARPVQLSDRSALYNALIERVKPKSTSGLKAWLTQLFRQIAPPAPEPVQLSYLGADWLDRAIALNAIAPLSVQELGDRFTETIPARWQQRVERQGQIWGVPWSWGVTAIAYNRQFVTTALEDWSDLWRPELKGKIVLPDSPREVIGLTQKSLGRTYDSSIDDAELREQLGRLHDQVLLYTSDRYLQTLLVEDSWVAVGWTQDLYQANQRDRRISVVIPASGSAIAWDLWVKPRQLSLAERDAPADNVLSSWFEFLLQPEAIARAARTSSLPLAVPVARNTLPAHLGDRAEFNPATLNRCEFLEPLPPTVAADYTELWRAMRSGEL